MTRPEGSGIRVYTCRPFTMKTLRDRCEEEGDCLLWTQGVTASGYPSAKIDGVTANLRVWVAAQKKIRLPEGYRLTTTCGNPRCLSHIGIKSRADLMREAYRNDPAMRITKRLEAQRRGLMKLTEEQREDARSSDEPTQVTADRLGISTVYVRQLRRGVSGLTANSVFNLAASMGVA